MTFDDRSMYRWRKMSLEQRERARQCREELRLPFHSPAHYESDCALYLITAACFEHAPVIGATPARMQGFEKDLLAALQGQCPTVFAWNVLPNHYHVLVENHAIRQLLRLLGQLHGRSSFRWNREENCRGRKVWFNAVETAMKSDGHFWATMNYVLHNAVRHGYVERWTDWPYCSARAYLENVGRDEATRIWKQYPLLDYGNDWDPPDL